MAVDARDARTFNGAVWSSAVMVDPDASLLIGGLDGVSCSTSACCVAIDAAGFSFMYAGGLKSKATTRTLLKLSARTLRYGHEESERLSVVVSPQYPGATPSGDVTVKVAGRLLCKITLSLGKGTCTLTARQLRTTSSIVASYPGSADFYGSSSPRTVLLVT